MAAGRVFWHWGLFLVSLVYSSLLIGNKHSKHINNKNRTVQHLLDPVQTQDESDITGYRFGVEDSYLYRRHIGKQGNPSRPKKGKYFTTRISLYSTSSSSVTYQLMKDSSIRQIVLSGDVHVDPGPVRFPCSVCKKPVATTH